MTLSTNKTIVNSIIFSARFHALAVIDLHNNDIAAIQTKYHRKEADIFPA